MTIEIIVMICFYQFVLYLNHNRMSSHEISWNGKRTERINIKCLV